MAPIRRSGEITLFAKREFDGFQTRLRTTTPFLVFELEDCLAMPEFRANFVILTKSETEKHTPHDLKEFKSALRPLTTIFLPVQRPRCASSFPTVANSSLGRTRIQIVTDRLKRRLCRRAEGGELVVPDDDAVLGRLRIR
jgi:hypothetical protein